MYLEKNNSLEIEDEFQTILYSIVDGVITTDVNSKVSRMNPVAERLTGWKESEASGKNLREVFNIIDELSGLQIENPVRSRICRSTGMSRSAHSIR